MDSNDKITQMAMFRFQVIHVLLHGDDERTMKKRILEQSEKLWPLPDGQVRQFAPGTIEQWYYDYRAGGLDALRSLGRSDRGSFRGLSENECDFLDRIVRNHPDLRTSVIIRLMRAKGLIENGRPSQSTIYRYVRLKRPERAAPVKERRSFEAPYAGNLWQVDILYGPYLPKKDSRGRWRKRQTFLVAIIDDHSRLLCHGEFYFEQNLLAYLHCLKTALRKRGIPEKLYCDNGRVFLSSQVKRIMAELGTTVLHTRCRDAAAKGKIERFFGTARTSFLEPAVILNPPRTLGELNRRFWKWLESDYNLAAHSGIGGATPVNRWMETSHKVRLLKPGTEDEIFLFETRRQVKKDGTFSLQSTIFETSWMLSGKKVTVSYDPFMPERVFVSHEGHDYGRANILNRQFNNKLPGRAQHREGEQS